MKSLFNTCSKGHIHYEPREAIGGMIPCPYCELARCELRYADRERELIKMVSDIAILRAALEEASHMIYGELYYDHPTVIQVRDALQRTL